MTPFRKYRGDADPAPFVGAIRSMSFSADAMTKQRNTIQRMSRRTPDGEVTLMRAGGIDYIDIMPNELGLGAADYVIFYRTRTGQDRFKFLDKNKRETGDILSTDLRIAHFLRSATGNEWGIGDLIFIDNPGRDPGLYDTTTGRMTSNAMFNIKGLSINYVFIENNVLYAVTGGGRWRVGISRKVDKSVYFASTFVKVSGGMLLENRTFYQPVSGIGVSGYYNTIRTINRDTGAASSPKGGSKETAPVNMPVVGKDWFTPTYSNAYRRKYYSLPGQWYYLNQVLTFPFGSESSGYSEPASNIYGGGGEVLKANFSHSLFGTSCYSIYRIGIYEALEAYIMRKFSSEYPAYLAKNYGYEAYEYFFNNPDGIPHDYFIFLKKNYIPLNWSFCLDMLNKHYSKIKPYLLTLHSQLWWSNIRVSPAEYLSYSSFYAFADWMNESYPDIVYDWAIRHSASDAVKYLKGHPTSGYISYLSEKHPEATAQFIAENVTARILREHPVGNAVLTVKDYFGKTLYSKRTTVPIAFRAYLSPYEGSWVGTEATARAGIEWKDIPDNKLLIIYGHPHLQVHRGYELFTYVEWNDKQITMQELYTLFSLPKDIQYIAAMLYVPNLGKDPEIAKFLSR